MKIKQGQAGGTGSAVPRIGVAGISGVLCPSGPRIGDGPAVKVGALISSVLAESIPNVIPVIRISSLAGEKRIVADARKAQCSVVRIVEIDYLGAGPACQQRGKGG